MDETDYKAGNPALAAAGRAVVLSGCSGGGKSALLAELARRGHQVVPEAGRQVVKEMAHLGLEADPSADPAGFALRMVWRAIGQFNAVPDGAGPVFFDRSVVEALCFLERTRNPVPDEVAAAVRLYRYASVVFFVPPWPEIFRQDGERRHDFAAAEAEYHALGDCYRRLGYRLVDLPRVPVAARADRVEAIVSDLLAGRDLDPAAGVPDQGPTPLGLTAVRM